MTPRTLSFIVLVGGRRISTLGGGPGAPRRLVSAYVGRTPPFMPQSMVPPLLPRAHPSPPQCLPPGMSAALHDGAAPAGKLDVFCCGVVG